MMMMMMSFDVSFWDLRTVMSSPVIPVRSASYRIKLLGKSSQVSNSARTLRIINSQNEVKMIPKDACVFEVGLSQPVQPPHHGLMAVRVGLHFIMLLKPNYAN
jgi:RNase P/RNase MRP subunit p29